MTTPRSVPVSAADGGFAALGLSATLCQVVAELGFATPTPVQAQAIPLLLAGRDLIGQSSTGSVAAGRRALRCQHHGSSPRLDHPRAEAPAVRADRRRRPEPPARARARAARIRPAPGRG